jgi:hypothetical protein
MRKISLRRETASEGINQVDNECFYHVKAVNPTGVDLTVTCNRPSRYFVYPQDLQDNMFAIAPALADDEPTMTVKDETQFQDI